MEHLSMEQLLEIEKLLSSDESKDINAWKISMVRLAHDGTDKSMQILRDVRKRVPSVLRGFLECAWDECSYFNFINAVDEVCMNDFDESQIPDMTDEAMTAECREIEDALSGKGVLVDLVPGVPPFIRLEYCRRLLNMIGSRRYQGNGFVHFDGCTGSCDFCVQKSWCDVARATENTGRCVDLT